MIQEQSARSLGQVQMERRHGLAHLYTQQTHSKLYRNPIGSQALLSIDWVSIVYRLSDDWVTSEDVPLEALTIGFAARARRPKKNRSTTESSR
ncbi:MAG: hypothetical protein AB9869_29120 [Verrucomicrobiia bacterium]